MTILTQIQYTNKLSHERLMHTVILQCTELISDVECGQVFFNIIYIILYSYVHNLTVLIDIHYLSSLYMRIMIHV